MCVVLLCPRQGGSARWTPSTFAMAMAMSPSPLRATTMEESESGTEVPEESTMVHITMPGMLTAMRVAPATSLGHLFRPPRSPRRRSRRRRSPRRRSRPPGGRCAPTAAVVQTPGGVGSRGSPVSVGVMRALWVSVGRCVSASMRVLAPANLHKQNGRGVRAGRAERADLREHARPEGGQPSRRERERIAWRGR